MISSTFVTDTWVKGSWEEFLKLAEEPAYEKGRFYYEYGEFRIEMAALGSSHSQDNSIASKVVGIYATMNNIRIKELINGSFQKTGFREAQPDLAFYVGKDFPFPPRNNSPINIDEYEPPALAIEIGATSLDDDLGRKRLLYERLGVKEYWVVDVMNSQVTAFEIANGYSGVIQESKVLPGLAIALVEEALQRSLTQDDGEITRWLIQSFS